LEGESLTSPELLDRLENLLAAGDREGVARTFLAEVTRLSPKEIERIASSLARPGRIAAAHTLPRELRSLEVYRLPDQVSKLRPVLLLLRRDSPAMDIAPDLLVGDVLDFWRDICLGRLAADPYWPNRM
jgi:hypothetical protein